MVPKNKEKNMYHPYSKDNPLVRKALYEAYSKKCAYCGDLMQPKNMHVDHILATNAKKSDDAELNQYIDELNSTGFILDSIENYHPSCASCNLKKSNRNFNVGNLRFFHNQAQDKLSKVLKIIEQHQSQEVSFADFEPNYDYWEQIDFSYQKDISEAIAGYRLQPHHVSACPRLAQVEEIKKRLEVVDYAIVEGEPGCGKSISVYQSAFDLSVQGYTVYRYVNKNTESMVFLPQSKDKKYLIIVDDAQNLPHFLLDQILAQSQKCTKIILAYTKINKDEPLCSEPIRITNYDAVKAIAQDYRKRKQEILPIVQKFDRFVGDGMMDTPFESRVENAATKNTPWLFNYTLRGGWNTTNEQLQTVYNHNKCGLLSTIIALFQILKMDNTIDFKWLQSYIQKFDDTIFWTEEDLDYLIKNKLIASTDDVRIVHIESAKSIIHSFYKIADEPSKQLICKILEDGYKENLFTEQGLIWLQNVAFSSVYYLREKIFTESLLDSVFSNLDVITDEERRGYIAFFLERMFSLHREKNGRHYFAQSEQIFARWISTATSKNAYAYSQLLNVLNNEGKETLKMFVSQINITSLLQNFSDSSIEDIYVWSVLLERLAYAYEKEERIEFGELLREPLVNKNQLVTVKNVAKFYYSMSEIFYLNPDLILDLLTSNVSKFQTLCSSNPEEAVDVLDFNFIDYVCGISHFSPSKPTKQQRDFSKKFVNSLPIPSIANFISHSLSRNWHRIYDIGRLLYRDNKKILSKIVKALDYDALNNCTMSAWRKTDGDLHLLFCFIAYGDIVSAQFFFEANKNKIEELGLPFIKILPEQAIELFEKGVKLRLFENCWNNESYDALKSLYCVSKDKYIEILDSEVAQLAAKISDFSVLDFEKEEKTLYEILAYIKNTYPHVISKVVPLLDFSKMKNGKLSMLKDDRCGRRCKKHFQDMIDMLIEYSDDINVGELNSIRTLTK